MLKNDIHPPRHGLNADPVLYGVAAGLAELFPLAPSGPAGQKRHERVADDASDGETDDGD